MDNLERIFSFKFNHTVFCKLNKPCWQSVISRRQRLTQFESLVSQLIIHSSDISSHFWVQAVFKSGTLKTFAVVYLDWIRMTRGFLMTMDSHDDGFKTIQQYLNWNDVFKFLPKKCMFKLLRRPLRWCIDNHIFFQINEKDTSIISHLYVLLLTCILRMDHWYRCHKEPD